MEATQRCHSVSERFPGKCLIATVPGSNLKNKNKLIFAPCFNFFLKPVIINNLHLKMLIYVRFFFDKNIYK